MFRSRSPAKKKKTLHRHVSYLSTDSCLLTYQFHFAKQSTNRHGVTREALFVILRPFHGCGLARVAENFLSRGELWSRSVLCLVTLLRFLPRGAACRHGAEERGRMAKVYTPTTKRISSRRCIPTLKYDVTHLDIHLHVSKHPYKHTYTLYPNEKL